MMYLQQAYPRTPDGRYVVVRGPLWGLADPAHGAGASLRGEMGEVVIAGCEAHVCLLQITLGLLRAGRRLWVVGPACGSRSSADHELAMERLRGAGAVIVCPR